MIDTKLQFRNSVQFQNMGYIWLRNLCLENHFFNSKILNTTVENVIVHSYCKRHTLNQLGVLQYIKSLQHSCYSFNTQRQTECSPVLLQTQPATTMTVWPDAKKTTASTSEEHTVKDPLAYVVSALVLKLAWTSSCIL